MADQPEPLLVKRYASRRLYNTETSDYVTLDDIAKFIRAGREVKIVDLKSGADLTRSYLLQIIAEHESKGDSVLPLGVLTDLVRSYTGAAHSIVPDFLASSFEMLRSGQSKLVENMTAINPLAQMPGFKAMREQQAAFFKAMSVGWVPPAEDEPTPSATAQAPDNQSREELDAIRKQLAEMQTMLAKMNK